MELVNLFKDYDRLVLVFIAAFWTMLFLQSGLDKLIDWKGNIAWLNGHFEKSILAGFVKPMVGILAVTELIAGGLCLAGAVQLMVSGKKFMLIQGLVVSMVALLMLFFGQRLAKDYEGARTIAVYFGIALLSGLVLKTF